MDGHSGFPVQTQFPDIKEPTMSAENEKVRDLPEKKLDSDKASQVKGGGTYTPKKGQ